MQRIRECHDGLFEGAVTERVIGAYYAVYNGLGYGHVESVYERALAIEIVRRGLHVATQVPTDVHYDGQLVGSFRADLVVESRVVVELKAGRSISPESELQLRNYLKCTQLEVGLLLHFGPRPWFRRLIWSNAARRTDPRDPPYPPDLSLRTLVARRPSATQLSAPASP